MCIQSAFWGLTFTRKALMEKFESQGWISTSIYCLVCSMNNLNHHILKLSYFVEVCSWCIGYSTTHLLHWNVHNKVHVYFVVGKVIFNCILCVDHLLELDLKTNFTCIIFDVHLFRKFSYNSISENKSDKTFIQQFEVVFKILKKLVYMTE